ncbi:MAG TPA: YciI family protein [Chthoniobacterales bacterium]
MNEKDDLSTAPTTSEHLLLFRGTDWYRDLSPDEIQTTMSQWYAWFDRLVKEGKVKAGQPLTNEGKIVSGKKGQTVADGPFTESKEAIGGYFLLRVSSFEEALAIAQQCPALEHGISVEVRPVASVCGPGKVAGHHVVEAVT